MVYSITALEKDPLTNVIGYVVRATVPEALWPRLADATKTGAYAKMHAADLADLRAGKIVERSGSYDMSQADVATSAAHLVAVQQAFQAEVTGGSLDARWQFNGFQFNAATSVWE